MPYQQWADEGFIELSPGSVIDYRDVRARIEWGVGMFDVQEICFDPWNSREMSVPMVEAGFPCIEVRQGFQTLSEPSKKLLELVASAPALSRRPPGSALERKLPERQVGQRQPDVLEARPGEELLPHRRNLGGGERAPSGARDGEQDDYLYRAAERRLVFPEITSRIRSWWSGSRSAPKPLSILRIPGRSESVASLRGGHHRLVCAQRLSKTSTSRCRRRTDFVVGRARQPCQRAEPLGRVGLQPDHQRDGRRSFRW